MDIGYIKASDGTGEVPRMTVTAKRDIGVPTLTVNSVDKLPAKFIATAGQYNASTKMFVPGTTTVFLGHATGATIAIDGYAPGYSDTGNEIGHVVVIKPTTHWADMIATVLGAVFNNDATLKGPILDQLVADALGTGKTATSLRVKPRSYQIDTTATLTPNPDTYSVYRVYSLGSNLTIANPAGTPNQNDVIMIMIKDAGAAKTITWGTAYTNISGLSTLTTTVAGKWHAIGLVYDSTSSKWQMVSITTGA